MVTTRSPISLRSPAMERAALRAFSEVSEPSMGTRMFMREPIGMIESAPRDRDGDRSAYLKPIGSGHAVLRRVKFAQQMQKRLALVAGKRAGGFAFDAQRRLFGACAELLAFGGERKRLYASVALTALAGKQLARLEPRAHGRQAGRRHAYALRHLFLADARVGA